MKDYFEKKNNKCKFGFLLMFNIVNIVIPRKNYIFNLNINVSLNDFVQIEKMYRLNFYILKIKTILIKKCYLFVEF